jgi:hypothetical protein
MDFTYLLGGLISVLVGFAGAILFVAAKSESIGRFLLSVVVASVVLSFVMLMDWGFISQQPINFFASSLLIFVVYAVLGCCLGASPVIGARDLLRRFRRRDRA